MSDQEFADERLKAGGCARYQRTTQFCAEAMELQKRVAALEALLERVPHYGPTFTAFDKRGLAMDCWPDCVRCAYEKLKETKQ